MKKSASREQALLKAGINFHGHLGPYLALGIRMGLLAVRALKPSGHHELSATVWTPTSPPKSCLLDGVQISSGCTLGKANIKVREARLTKTKFRKGKRTVTMELTRDVMKILRTLTEHTAQSALSDLALSLLRMSDKQLFVVRE